MSNSPFTNSHLLAQALDRAKKQFPEMDPQVVVSTVESQYDALMDDRPVVQSPMRDLRNSPRHDI
jgi:hypothetical protein